MKRAELEVRAYLVIVGVVIFGATMAIGYAFGSAIVRAVRG